VTFCPDGSAPRRSSPTRPSGESVRRQILIVAQHFSTRGEIFQGCEIKGRRHRIEMHLQSLTHLLSSKLAENEQGSKGYSYIYRTAKKNVFMSIAIVFDKKACLCSRSRDTLLKKQIALSRMNLSPYLSGFTKICTSILVSNAQCKFFPNSGKLPFPALLSCIWAVLATWHICSEKATVRAIERAFTRCIWTCNQGKI